MTSRGREQHDFASQVADRLRQLGLRQPALTALEIGRPFAFVAGQLLWLAQPLLGLLTPRDTLSQLAELLEEPESVGMLIESLGREHGDGTGEAEWTR
jgi:hypothetical protein